MEYTDEIKLRSTKDIEFIDITGRVREICKKSGIKEGMAVVFSNHTTSAVRVNERCDRLQIDMVRALKDIVPAKAYRHDEDTVDVRANARGHIMALMLGASETIPITAGDLSTGTWQSVFFIELDGPRNSRTVTVRVIGDNGENSKLELRNSK